MIDTLSISKQLQESGISAREADAIALQMGRLIDSDLASKHNLKETELLLSKDILQLKKEIKEVELSLLKEIKEVELSLQKEIKEVELKLSTQLNAHLKWVPGFLVGQAALIVTLIKLL